MKETIYFLLASPNTDRWGVPLLPSPELKSRKTQGLLLCVCERRQCCYGVFSAVMSRPHQLVRRGGARNLIDCHAAVPPPPPAFPSKRKQNPQTRLVNLFMWVYEGASCKGGDNHLCPRSRNLLLRFTIMQPCGDFRFPSADYLLLIGSCTPNIEDSQLQGLHP